MSLLRVYLGPYVWDELPTPHWRAPSGTVNAIDLRPLPAQGQAVTPAGNGLFVTSDVVLDANYRLFGVGRMQDVVPRESDRAVFAAMVGVPTVDGDNALQWLYSAMSWYADPTGDVAPRPILPTSQGVMELRLSGGVLGVARRFRFGMQEEANIRAVKQRDYRAIRQACLDGVIADPQLYLKWLGAQGQDFRVDNPEDFFIPGDLPREVMIRPTTSIVEDFNIADGTTLGPNLTWTEYSGTSAGDSWEIFSNRARHLRSGALNNARAESDLSSDNHSAQADVITLGTSGNKQGSVNCRFAAAAFTFYMCRAIGFDSTIGLTKLITGTETDIDTPVSPGITPPFGLKVQADGSSITGYKDGGQILSATDTAITGNLRCGMGYFSNTVAADVDLDDFEAADLGISESSGPGTPGELDPDFGPPGSLL